MVLIVVVVMGCNSWVTVPSCVPGSCRWIWMVATMMGGYGDCGMGGSGCGGWMWRFFFVFWLVSCGMGGRFVVVVVWVVGFWWVVGWWVLW